VRNKKTRARRMYIGDLLGLAEGLGKGGFFLDPHASILWVKNVSDAGLSLHVFYGKGAQTLVTILRCSSDNLKTRLPQVSTLTSFSEMPGCDVRSRAAMTGFLMDNAEQLILPRLPENLESLHKEEEKIRTEALLAINADSALKEHLDMVHACLDTVHAFTLQYQKQTEDELTVQLLGIRLFNASASALALMLAGYYQNSVTMLRDLLETGFLIDYFAIDRPKIQEWRQSNEKERKRKFGPAKIRQAWMLMIKLRERRGLKFTS